MNRSVGMRSIEGDANLPVHTVHVHVMLQKYVKDVDVTFHGGQVNGLRLQRVRHRLIGRNVTRQNEFDKIVVAFASIKTEETMSQLRVGQIVDGK
jgi:hypothetical protein